MLRHILLGFLLLVLAAAARAQLYANPQPQPAGNAAPTQAQATPAVPLPQVFGAPAAAAARQAQAQPAPAAPPPVPVSGPAPGAQPFDYGANLKSEVFGAQLFTGAFAQSGAAIFNPDHVIAVGDQLQVRLWGAFDFDALLVTDPQGNIFLPHVGPVRVAGVPNRSLQKVLEDALRKAFRANVHSYISLAAAQPVRVYVTGFVHRPGMYHGSSTDSVLRYLDQAGGIDPERGSFLDVQVRRGSQLRASVNLYDFLLTGTLAGVQLGDGDVIVVQPRKSTFRVSGLAENAKRFEFTGRAIDLKQLAALAKPRAQATHVRVVRNTGIVQNTEYYALAEAGAVKLDNGDEIEFTADRRPGTIAVRVEGEHVSPQEYVLPYGTRMGELVKKIQFTERSDAANLQLFRISVRERQKLMLDSAIKSLESSVLTARSGTGEEAKLRRDEADLVLQWADRARRIEPSGRVLVAQSKDRDDLLLENGDVLRVPSRDGLVLINGEVLFPNAVAFDPKLGVEEYIKRAGGYTQNADTSRVIIAHRDGSFEEMREGVSIRSGDEVLVLPKVDTKLRQFWKDVTQIMFQIAVVAGVVFGL